MATHRRKKRGRPAPVVRPAPAAPGQSRAARWAWLAAGFAALVGALAVTRACMPGSRREDDLVAEATRPAAPERAAERMRVRVVRRYPHQRDAFTQGLVWHDGALYESTGQEGQSSLRLVELESGEVLRRRDADPRLFAEGLALVGDLLYQITWTQERALVYRSGSFDLVREYRYEGEGWGLCFDGSSLVMSDGSAALAFRDPATFEVRRTTTVRLEGRPVVKLNELECAGDVVWANVWEDEHIVRIDPRTGRVTAVVDASGLLAPEERAGADVLNGIAWMPESGHLLLTGKYWPWLYEVELEPAAGPDRR